MIQTMTSYRCITLIVLINIFCWGQGSNKVQSPEKKLIDYLMKDYDPRVRPTLNVSAAVPIKFELSLQQIIDLDEKSQVVTVSMYMVWEWKDDFLTWNQSEFGGIKDIRLPAKNVWKPDILIYNSAVSSFDQMLQTNVIVHHTGKVEWLPPGIFETTCEVDIRYFPYDEQTCKMKFGTWTHHGFLIDLVLGAEDAQNDSYTASGEYEFISMKGIRTSAKYDCCPHPFVDITYYLRIRRRILYYGFNLILPCLLICFLTVLVFILPADAGERITLTITILLALVVFLQLVNDSLPPSEEIPLLVKFFACSIVMVTMSVVATVVSLSFHHTNSSNANEMPKYIRWIFLYALPKLLCMKRPGECSYKRKFLDHPDEEKKITNGHNIQLSEYSESRPFAPAVGSEMRAWQNETRETVLDDVNREMKEILDEVKFITNRLHSEDDDERMALEWQFAAVVLDKFCLYVFTIYLVLATIFTLGLGQTRD